MMKNFTYTFYRVIMFVALFVFSHSLSAEDHNVSSGTFDITTVTDGDVINVSGTVTLTGDIELSKNIRVVCSERTNLTIQNVNINTNLLDAVAFSGTGNTLVIKEKNILKSTKTSNAAVVVPENAELTISGSGSLVATGATWGAGIGEGYGRTSGEITITGGAITVTAGSYAASIGGGHVGGSKAINISGGTIVATGSYTHGIGNGYLGTDMTDSVSISNGARVYVNYLGATTNIRGAGTVVYESSHNIQNPVPVLSDEIIPVTISEVIDEKLADINLNVEPWVNSNYAYFVTSKLAYTEDNGELTVIGINGDVEEENLIIPSEVNSKPVVAIGTRAFHNKSSITSVTIHASVKKIGADAFRGSGLTSVIFNEGSQLEEVGSAAFYTSTNLTVTLPEIQKETTSTVGNWVWNTNALGTGTTVTEIIPNNLSAVYAVEIMLFTTEIVEGGLSVTGYNGTDMAVTIPSVINGTAVVAIGDEAFKSKTTITSITIPDLVKTIGTRAFNSCSNLSHVTISASVQEIGSFAFYSCPKVSSVTFLENSQLEKIGQWAFNTFSGVIVTLPEIQNETTSTVGKWIWNESPEGTSTTIIQVVGSHSAIYSTEIMLFETEAVEGGLSVTGYRGTDTDVTIPSVINNIAIVAIGTSAFSSKSLTSVTIPNTVIKIGASAFSNNSISSVDFGIDSQLGEVGRNAFSNNTDLTVTLPEIQKEATSTVGNWVWNTSYLGSGTTFTQLTQSYGPVCYAVEIILFEVEAVEGGLSITGYNGTDKDVIIPSEINETAIVAIGSEAFMSKSITSVTIPASVKKIGLQAFATNSQLSSVTFEENSQLEEVESWAFWTGSGVIVTLPEIQNETTSAIGIWVWNYSPDGTSGSMTQITGSHSACYAAEMMLFVTVSVDGGLSVTGYRGTDMDVTIPSVIDNLAVVAIGNRAFKSKSLTSVSIPASVKTIGENAFSYCGLTSVSFESESQLEEVGSYAFYGNSSLTVTLPEIQKVSTSSVGRWIWNTYTTGTGITMTEITQRAYSACYAVEIILFETAVVDGGLSITAYKGTDTEITVPSEIDGTPVVAIGTYAFFPKSILSVTISASIKTIGEYAFYNCNLSAVIFQAESQLEEVESYAFYSNSGLIVVLPDITKQPSSSDKGYIWNSVGGDGSVVTSITQENVRKAFEIVEVSGFLTTGNGDGTLTISGYVGGGGDITIPSEIDGETVTSIDSNVFKEKGITALTIPESITSIGNSAFANNDNLEIATINSKTVSFGTGVFSGSANDYEVYGYAESTASIYAKTSGYTFIPFTSEVNYMAGTNCTLIGGSKIETVYTSLSPVDVPSVNPLDDYQFAGWKTEGDETLYSTTELESLIINADITFTAYCEPITYNILYSLNDGTNSVDNPATYTLETATISLVAPTKAGYTFEGWFTESGFETEVTAIAQGSNGDQTFYAKWDGITYNISYDEAGTKNPAENKSTFTIEDADFTLLAANDSTGYTFGGWFTNAEFSDSVSTPAIAQGSIDDQTFYAKWDVITYDISYDNAGTKNPAENKSTFTIEAADFTLLVANDSIGYTFGGWFTNAEFTDSVSTPAIAQGSIDDKTFYAQWNVITYDITYRLNGGINNGGNPATYTFDTETISLSKPKRTGYSFKGWFIDNDFSTKSSTIVKGNTGEKIFYAKWFAIEYSITYHLNGGVNNFENPESYTIKTSDFILSELERECYSFMGWFEGEDYTSAVTDVRKGSIGDKEFFAKWEAKLSNVPVVTGTIEKQFVEATKIFDLQLPEDLFFDEDCADTLIFSAQNLAGEWPSWLLVDAVSGNLYGTPNETDTGICVIELSATDKAENTVSLVFELVVSGSGKASLSGTLSAGGQAIGNGVKIVVYIKEESNYQLLASTSSSTKGSFMFYNLESGNYIVQAVISDPSTYPDIMSTYYNGSSDWADAQIIELEVGSAELVIIDMLEKPKTSTGTCRILGTVISRDGSTEKSGLILKSTQTDEGEPVEGATVLLKQDGQDINTRITGADGKYCFSNLPEGKYQIEVLLPGYIQNEALEVEVSSTAEEEISDEAELNVTIWLGTKIITDIDETRLTVRRKVYPNPTHGVLFVEIENNNEERTEIAVFTIAGEKVFQQSYEPFQTIKIDLSGKPHGIYLLNTRVGSSVMTDKVILR